MGLSDRAGLTVSQVWLLAYGALGLVLVACKLLGLLAWSWLLVTAPWWMPVVMVTACLMGVVLFALCLGLYEEWRGNG